MRLTLACSCRVSRLSAVSCIDRGRQRPLERGDDATGHLIGRQALVLPSYADDGNLDAREDVHRHTQRGQRADQENEQCCHDERVGATQRNADYGKHISTGMGHTRKSTLVGFRRAEQYTPC